MFKRLWFDPYWHFALDEWIIFSSLNNLILFACIFHKHFGFDSSFQNLMEQSRLQPPITEEKQKQNQKKKNLKGCLDFSLNYPTDST